MADLLPRRQLLMIFLSFILALSPSIGIVQASFIEPILVGEDPKDAKPDLIDIRKVYLTNNGTHFRFIVECEGTPDTKKEYWVYLDTKDGGAGADTYEGADFYLQGGGTKPGLYEWVSGEWTYKVFH